LLTRYDCIGLIEDITESKPVVVFMKGSPQEPKCGHSRRLVKILESIGLSQFTAVDVLQSQTLRETLKERTGLNTIPQVRHVHVLTPPSSFSYSLVVNL